MSPPTPRTSQEVIRPPEGIARGVWELPPGAFYGALAVLLLVCSLYGARRLGVFPKRRLAASVVASDRGRSRR